MSITKYQIFVKVAELGSLTRAAEALGYTQPAVSHSVSSLESRFGFPLFYRSRDACRLTENGERLLDACREILRGEEEIEATVHALNGVLTGSIRVGSLRSMLTEFVPRVSYRFSQAYPQIGLTLSELTFQEVAAALGAGTIDAGFTSAPLPEDGKLRFTPLFDDPVCLILPPEHPLLAYERVPVLELDGLDFIMPARGYDDVYQVITDQVPIRPNVRYRVGSDIAAVGMVVDPCPEPFQHILKRLGILPKVMQLPCQPRENAQSYGLPILFGKRRDFLRVFHHSLLVSLRIGGFRKVVHGFLLPVLRTTPPCHSRTLPRFRDCPSKGRLPQGLSAHQDPYPSSHHSRKEPPFQGSDLQNNPPFVSPTGRFRRAGGRMAG